ncbi:ABC transporter ATP-binding protein [Paenibacillus sp. FA6]|uniref:ABC transporter ATP-binding protein n=1 Tax=Paenibacillus sp. FA6 TaxID=3413029 RepID=UPI003F65D558
MSLEAIKIEGLYYTYEGDSNPVLKDTTLSVPYGQWVAVIGAGGSGKSTLCQLLNGYLPRTGGGHREGVVVVDGVDPVLASIADITERIGLVFQDADAQLVQGNVEADVAFGPENLRVPPADIAHRISASLMAVGLTSHRHAAVRELSGGQRQRAATAAVLALEPRVLVFDDCAASLDGAAQVQFVQLCVALHEQGRTLLSASGRFDDVARAAERVIVLEGGSVVLDGSPQELLRNHSEQLAHLGLLPQVAECLASPSVPISSFGTVNPPAQTPTGASSLVTGGTSEQHLADGELSGAWCSPVPRIAGASSSSPLTPLLQLRELSYTYPSGTQALQAINFIMQPGEWGMLVGENGSGKSTLSRLLMGLLPVPRNKVFWRGQDMAALSVAERAEEIGYVFQQPEHQFVAHSVWDEVSYAYKSKRHKRSAMTVEEVESVEQILESAGLVDRRHDSPYLLSQGEKKILSVISQFVLPKKLVILDEPTSGIDYAAAERILRICRERSQQGTALLMITHDPIIVEKDATIILKLHQGILEQCKTTV